VLHEQELTYSVIAPKDSFPEPGLLPSYRVIAKALIQGLIDLGIKGDLATPRSRGQNSSGACFLASSWYEVTVEGRKLIGSAQRRVKTHILQQGSILLAVDHEAMVDLFPSAGISKPELIERSRAKITSLGELIDRPLRAEQLKQSIKRGFRQVLGIEFVRGEPTVYEQNLAQRLNEQKYSTHTWNFKRGE
jgi:lipoate-protein ligase A